MLKLPKGFDVPKSPVSIVNSRRHTLETRRVVSTAADEAKSAHVIGVDARTQIVAMDMQLVTAIRGNVQNDFVSLVNLEKRRAGDQLSIFYAELEGAIVCRRRGKRLSFGGCMCLRRGR